MLNTILEQKNGLICSKNGQQQKYKLSLSQLNQPLPFVGHGRGAAYGMMVANLLETIGYQVEREYYVNDAGRQMAILATSTFCVICSLMAQI